MYTRGVQLWSLREQLAEDPKTCLEKISQQGYHHAEGFDLIQLASIKPLLDHYSIDVKSSFILWSHITGRYDIAEQISYTWMPKTYGLGLAIDHALALGLDTVVCGYLPPEERIDPEWYKHLADHLNRAGEACQKGNLKLLYHNHTFEFEPQESGIPYQYLMEHTDPAYVNFEVDVLWSAVAGQNAKALLSSFSDRIKQLHLKTGEAVSAPLYDEKTYLPIWHDYPLGTGFVDIKGILEEARKMNVDRYYVEQEYGKDLYKSLDVSLQFLNRCFERTD